jgi:hypothetical protein
MAARRFECSLTWLDTRTQRPGLSWLTELVHALTPLVMFYKIAPTVPAYVRLAQIREFADVTGQPDDNFQ